MGAMMTIKGHLQVSIFNVKAVFRREFLDAVKSGPQNGDFVRKMGLNVKFWFCYPQKAHPCAELQLLIYFTSKSSLLCGIGRTEEKKTKNSPVNKSTLELAHVGNESSYSVCINFAGW